MSTSESHDVVYALQGLVDRISPPSDRLLSLIEKRGRCR
jgi:hypothetical protein